VPAAFLERFARVKDARRRTYGAMTAFVDEQVGRLTAALRARNMWDWTIFVLSSDNGGPEGRGIEAVDVKVIITPPCIFYTVNH
jgi:arylsulfatase A-like enzyme